MSDVDALERALRAAEAEAQKTIASSEPAVAKVDKIIQTFLDIAGRDRPRDLMQAIAAAEEGRAHLVNGLELARSAVADIREAIANLYEDASTSGSLVTTSVAASGSTVIQLSSSDPAHVRRLNKPPTNATIVVDGRFSYETDDKGRVVKATATLETIDLEHPRSEHAQKTLSGKLPGDDAGHLFARIFQGPGQKINLVPMEALGVNRGEYKSLEAEWRAAIEGDRRVDVSIELSYDGDTRRPDFIFVSYDDGVEKRRVSIENEPQGGGE